MKTRTHIHLDMTAVVAMCIACACAPAGKPQTKGATDPAPAAAAPNAPVTTQGSSKDTGLPPLPEASGSSREGGTYTTLPPVAKQVLQGLGCRVEDSAKVQLFAIPGAGKDSDFLVTDKSGPDFHYWMRAFHSAGDTTGYLVQLNGCPASTVGMRAYVVKGTSAPEDVTAALAAKVEGITPKYTDQGVGELFALTLQLDKVPVVRWIAEADPDRKLVEDARTFDHGNFVHGGFLVWQKDRFEVLQKVPAALWPCDDSQLFPCGADPFVIGR
ncbi:hypothetical protein [Pseudoxanthomonas sp. UC19_8]|uniref:hypothetical protein n=1 Tax=Pseudoxanthomonas sp. UC19_8 TaxID=3350175 RepID=UPI0036D420CB